MSGAGQRGLSNFELQQGREDAAPLRSRITAQHERVRQFAKEHGMTITRLRNEIDAYLDIAEDVEAAVLEGGYWYRTVRSANGNAVYLRARAGPHGQRGRDEVVLDMDAVARGRSYAMLGIVAVSPEPSARYVCYTVDVRGDDTFELRVERIHSHASTRRRPLVVIPRVSNAVWGVYVPGEPLRLYYAQVDDTQRAFRVCRQELDTAGTRARHRTKAAADSDSSNGESDSAVTEGVSADEVLLECVDPRMHVDVMSSKDARMVTATVATRDANEVWLLERSAEDARARYRASIAAGAAPVHLGVRNMQPGTPYTVTHGGDEMLVMASAHEDGEQGVQVLDAASVVQACRNASAVDAPHVRSGAGLRRVVVSREHAVPARHGTFLDDADVFSSSVVLYGHQNGRPWMELWQRASGTLLSPVTVALPDGCVSVTPGTNSDYNAAVARCSAVFADQPACELDVCLRTGTVSVVRQARVGLAPGRPLFRASDYVSYKLHAASSAGALIPIDIVHRSDLGIDVQEVQERARAAENAPQLDWRQERRIQTWLHKFSPPALTLLSSVVGSAPPRDTFRFDTECELPSGARIEARTWRDNNPVMLHWYGAYGTKLVPAFAPERLPLLSRGFVAAWAHVRGGGEFGRSWYHAGRGLNKMQGLRDAVAVLHALLRCGLTRASLVCTRSESAGALLSAHIVNTAASLAKCHVLSVPFLNVEGAMRNPTAPLTQQEYDEWGNPGDPSQLLNMRTFCAMTNAPGPNTTEMPAVLALAGESDVRAPAADVVAFTERLQAANSGVALQLCNVSDDAGHFGAGSRDERISLLAFEQAFVLHALGLRLRTEDWQLL